MKSVFHGSGDAAMAEAIERARQIGGSVVWSWPPTNATYKWGYWSDPSEAPMLRAGERIVWPEEENES